MVALGGTKKPVLYTEDGEPVSETNPLPIIVSDGVDTADVVENVDENTDLSGTKGLVTSSVMYIQNGSVTKPAKMDLITHDLIAIDHEHHEIHEGDNYFIKTYIVDVGGIGSITNFAFTSPSTAKRAHAKAHLAPDSDFTVTIYEGSVITGGTPVAGVNNDRDSNNVAELLALASPTHTTPGTNIWTARTGGGKNPVGVSPGLNYEIIAATDTVYVFEIIKNIAQVGIVDVDFFWYEHEPKS